MNKNNLKLVWSDDPKDQEKIKAETKPPKLETSEQYVKSRNWVAVFRLEKGGRRGKTVTVIDQLPKHEAFLAELCRELKTRCGAGGTYLMEGKDGVIEIQGDRRDAIKAIFVKKGYKFKGM